jgi:hypothetical protein
MAYLFGTRYTGLSLEFVVFWIPLYYDICSSLSRPIMRLCLSFQKENYILRDLETHI